MPSSSSIASPVQSAVRPALDADGDARNERPPDRRGAGEHDLGLVPHDEVGDDGRVGLVEEVLERGLVGDVDRVGAVRDELGRQVRRRPNPGGRAESGTPSASASSRPLPRSSSVTPWISPPALLGERPRRRGVRRPDACSSAASRRSRIASNLQASTHAPQSVQLSLMTAMPSRISIAS